MQGQQEDKFNAAEWQKWAGMGFEFAGVIGIFVYMGYVADEKLGSGPWLLLTGFFVGFVGMLYLVFKEVWKIGMKDSKQKEDKKP
jgi:F0F1-type ATP synthase assembly protein I